MGVPAFFRWLTRKYTNVVLDCREDPAVVENNYQFDPNEPNPNEVEFDNLYLDMNGIIHPCTHPENKPPPETEDEMMVAIFECIDRIVAIVRPRKVLYLAIDGVAPRAKMNQQRSRRFRAAKETYEKLEQLTSIKAELRAKGVDLPADKSSCHFDSNCITPGTEFMSRLSECLHYYILDRITHNAYWKRIKIILSDASVPGEGEHKIMDFIRRQRAMPSHNPNTHHCLCGADADLIMLGLATHEPNFTIIREEFIMNQPRKCEICGQSGHEMKECKGLPNENPDGLITLPAAPTRYIFVRLSVLREYLEEELKIPGLPFEYNFERALDDWVFMCFFVGNDFLPHLPSLEIRENAIDRLINLYKKTVRRTQGFLTDSGDVFLNRVQLIMNDLGVAEDEIFRKRNQNEINFRNRNKYRKQQDKVKRLMSEPANKFKSVSQIELEVQNEMEDEAEVEPIDEVRLHEDGYKDRYYKLKFDLPISDQEARYTIAQEYVRGLCWVLKYYYQGCASWEWYYPYHYAPFAADFINVEATNVEFEKGTVPFSPLEQLMSVYPAASGNLVPAPFAALMTDPDSPILDFYPNDFMIDLNGKKFAWQGVALLPFVDEVRLKKTLKPRLSMLTPAELKRNQRGHDFLYITQETDCYPVVSASYVKACEASENDEPQSFELVSTGVCGTYKFPKSLDFKAESLPSPVQGLPALSKVEGYVIAFYDPQFPDGFKFPADRLPGAQTPPRVLQSNDIESMRNFGRHNNNNNPNNNRPRYDPKAVARNLGGNAMRRPAACTFSGASSSVAYLADSSHRIVNRFVQSASSSSQGDTNSRRASPSGSNGHPGGSVSNRNNDRSHPYMGQGQNGNDQSRNLNATRGRNPLTSRTIPNALYRPRGQHRRHY